MIDARTKTQEEYPHDVEKILRQAIEFDLYESANRFVKNEIVKKGYRISMTRLNNLSRAFRISYVTFNKLLNNYLSRLQREMEEARGVRAASVRRNWEILKKIKVECSLDILERISLGLEKPASRAERKQQSGLKQEYVERLAPAWFVHFVSAYMFKESSWE